MSKLMIWCWVTDFWLAKNYKATSLPRPCRRKLCLVNKGPAVIEAEPGTKFFSLCTKEMLAPLLLNAHISKLVFSSLHWDDGLYTTGLPKPMANCGAIGLGLLPTIPG